MPDWVRIIMNSTILIVVLFFLTKWLGKKQLSQLNIFEYITGIVLGGIVAIHASTLQFPLIYGLLAMLVWFLIPFGLEYLGLKSKKVRDFTQGKSTVIIQNGKIMEENLKKERYTADDLMENLRNRNIFRAADVEFAVLEPTGIINVLPKTEKQPLTAKDLDIKLAPKKEPQIVVMDGKVIHEGLANASLNINWLETELEKLQVSIENIFLGQVDSDGQLTVDLFDDKLTVPAPAQKQLLMASMKKVQADLELFALATDNNTSKNLYTKQSEQMQKVIQLTEDYLK
ncbi:DUF421 domain-containing protein [Virgibacillus halophilus]|uniref:DUF421 domain-containing protein n=1 Tax=Tigheibacillus halophilus TaxID=361280 RepID=UPI003638EEB5